MSLFQVVDLVDVLIFQGFVFLSVIVEVVWEIVLLVDNLNVLDNVLVEVIMDGIVVVCWEIGLELCYL